MREPGGKITLPHSSRRIVAGFLTITSQLATTPTVTTNTVVTMTPMILIAGFKCHGTRTLPYAPFEDSFGPPALIALNVDQARLLFHSRLVERRNDFRVLHEPALHVSGSEVFGGEERDAQIDPDDVDRKLGARLQLELACARLHRDPFRLA